MRHLYIVPKGFHLHSSMYFELWHGTELPSGEVLISGQFTSDYAQREWESMPCVELVGAEYDPSPIDDKHADKLASHGVKRGHTAKHVRKLAKQFHPLM